jgi:subtilisin family serine protease
MLDYSSLFQDINDVESPSWSVGSAKEFFSSLPSKLFGNISTHVGDWNISTIQREFTTPWHMKYSSTNDHPILPLSPTLGKGVDIYIIDSGIDLDHPEFQGGRTTQIFSLSSGCKTYNLEHGTGIASIAAGISCGLAKSSNIYSVNVFPCREDDIGVVCDSANIGMHTEIIHLLLGISAVVQHRESRKDRKCIVNMSFGIQIIQGLGDNFALDLQETFEILSSDPNVILVAAGGNNATDAQDFWPATDDRVVSVGSYGERFSWTTFSGYNVDIIAPGQNILAADSYNVFGYKLVKGTSTSCAFVSGFMASLWSMVPSWSRRSIKIFTARYLNAHAHGSTLSSIEGKNPTTLLRYLGPPLLI